MKAMEDVKVSYDRTVRNSAQEVLQFLYGEDGMSGEYVEDQVIELMQMDAEKIRRVYRHDLDQESYGKGWILNEELRTKLFVDFSAQQVLEDEYEAIKEDKLRLCKSIFPDGEVKQHIPINIMRLLEFAKAQFPPSVEQLKKQDPVAIAKSVSELLNDKLIVVKQTCKADTISAEVQENATVFMKAHLRTVLNSRRLMEREQLGVKAVHVSFFIILFFIFFIFIILFLIFFVCAIFFIFLIFLICFICYMFFNFFICFIFCIFLYKYTLRNKYKLNPYTSMKINCKC